MKNKKLLIGIVSAIVVLIVVILILVSVLTSTKELYKAFDNTLNLKSYKLSVLNEGWFEKNKVIYVERNTQAGTIEFDEEASFHDDGAYHINGIEVLEDDKFVFDNDEDNYYYYYSGSNVSTRIIEYDGLVNNLLEKLKLDVKENGYLMVNTNNQTSNPKIFAAGDLTGAKSTVAWACRNGRDTAYSIMNFIKEGE